MRSWFVMMLCLGAAPLSAQDVLLSADSAILAGQPWHATQILAPALSSATTRTPDAVMLAARAAAAWQGWTTVQRLLDHQPWLDTRFDRLGERLLAQAALSDQRNLDALSHALAAAAQPAGRSAGEQALRLVLLARSYDRLNQLDSAAAIYREAAGLLPDIADWLWLRAAGVTADSAARQALYDRVADPAATARIPWTEALARDRINDYAGAASRYDRLGAWAAAIRVRWRGDSSPAGRRTLTAELARRIGSNTSTSESQDAIDLVDRLDPPFSREERLLVARRAALVNRPAEAASQYARASLQGALDAADRFRYGTALGDLDKWNDAAGQFAAIRSGPYLAPAAYAHARAVLRSGDQSTATSELRHIVQRYRADTTVASTALFLLGDLAIDDSRTSTARSDLLTLSERYPTSAFRDHALVLAALIAFEHGKPGTAANDLARGMARRKGSGVDGEAMMYWLARARDAMGQRASARADYLALLNAGPEDYYAELAAARLDTVPWHAAAADTVTMPPALAGYFARIGRLDGLGLDAEAQFERERLIATSTNAADALRAAEAFDAAHYPTTASRMALRAVAAGAPRDSMIWRLLYPLPFGATLTGDARREHVDPLLAAAVIRRESGFDPTATSHAGARGLMQIEPATGRDLAFVLNFPDFDPAMLWIPDVNLALGLHHFAQAIARYPDVQRALASYNAGTSRVDQWSRAPLSGDARSGAAVRQPLDDPEAFVERMSYAETRTYVRLVMTNLAVYRLLYGTSG